MMLERVVNLETVYVLSGLLLLVFACFTALDRKNPSRAGTAAFWAVLGVLFVLGSYLPYWASGALVIALVAIDGLDLFRHGDYGETSPAERERSARRFGAWLFVPVLLIPALTYALTRTLSTPDDPPAWRNAALYFGLGVSSLVALAAAAALTRPTPRQMVDEGRRLAEAIGPAVILPQLLASLGELLRMAKVGDAIGLAAQWAIPDGSALAAAAVLCVAMALFTFCLGNSFAAFPVIIAGIGVPLLVDPFGANPALVGAMAMTAASCGTLCTPMAANFNIVPPALFEMRDRYGVIKTQAPVAAVLLALHVLVLWALVRAGAFR